MYGHEEIGEALRDLHALAFELGETPEGRWTALLDRHGFDPDAVEHGAVDLYTGDGSAELADEKATAMVLGLVLGAYLERRAPEQRAPG